MRKASVGREWQRAVVILTGTVVCVVTVGVVYWAQSIFIPMVLAVFLTFLLNPVVSFLSRHGFGRTPAVIATVFAAGVGLGLGGWLVTAQISNLLKELPDYTQNVRKKVRSLKSVAEHSSGLAGMVVDINQELGGGPAHQRERGSRDDGDVPADGPPTAVVVEPRSAVWLSRITMFLSPLMELLGELSLAIIGDDIPRDPQAASVPAARTGATPRSTESRRLAGRPGPHQAAASRPRSRHFAGPEGHCGSAGIFLQ